MLPAAARVPASGPWNGNFEPSFRIEVPGPPIPIRCLAEDPLDALRFATTTTARLLACVVAASSFAAASHAAVRRVPHDHARISDALLAAAPGDSVLVGPGVFSTSEDGEVYPLELNTTGVSLIGSGMGVSILDAEDQGSAVRLRAPETRVEGFTITGGRTVRGGGVFIGVGATGTPVVARNLVIGNGASDRGSGIFSDLGTTPWIHHNVVWQSYDVDPASGGDPHGVQLYGAHGVVEHNVIGRGDSNGLLNEGAASTPVVRNNILYRNGTPGVRGRGFCALGNPATTIRNNLFFENVIAAVIIRVDGTPMDVSGTTANGLDPDDAVDGNFDLDPRFANEALNDWHLAAGSPAIDAGWPGTPPDPDGTPADVGAFWFDQGTVDTGPNAATPRLSLACVPNPVPRAAGCALRFELARPASVVLSLHDARGREVARLWSGRAPAGRSDFRWDGRDAAGRRASGIYFARLVANSEIVASKLVVLDE